MATNVVNWMHIKCYIIYIKQLHTVIFTGIYTVQVAIYPTNLNN